MQTGFGFFVSNANFIYRPKIDAWLHGQTALVLFKTAASIAKKRALPGAQNLPGRQKNRMLI